MPQTIAWLLAGMPTGETPLPTRPRQSDEILRAMLPEDKAGVKFAPMTRAPSSAKESATALPKTADLISKPERGKVMSSTCGRGGRTTPVAEKEAQVGLGSGQKIAHDRFRFDHIAGTHADVVATVTHNSSNSARNTRALMRRGFCGISL